MLYSPLYIVMNLALSFGVCAHSPFVVKNCYYATEIGGLSNSVFWNLLSRAPGRS